MLYDDLLDGFEIVPAVDMPALTLDKFYRLYINRSARRLLDVKSYDMLSLAYRHDTHEIAIIKAGDRFDARWTAELTTSVFPLDKRHYLHVKVFARLYNVKVGEPLKDGHNRGGSDGRVFVFRRHYSISLVRTSLHLRLPSRHCRLANSVDSLIFPAA